MKLIALLQSFKQARMKIFMFEHLQPFSKRRSTTTRSGPRQRTIWSRPKVTAVVVLYIYMDRDCFMQVVVNNTLVQPTRCVVNTRATCIALDVQILRHTMTQAQKGNEWSLARHSMRHMSPSPSSDRRAC